MDRAAVARHYSDLLADELEHLARIIALMDSTEAAARLLRRRAIQLKTLQSQPPRTQHRP